MAFGDTQELRYLHGLDRLVLAKQSQRAVPADQVLIAAAIPAPSKAADKPPLNPR